MLCGRSDMSQQGTTSQRQALQARAQHPSISSRRSKDPTVNIDNHMAERAKKDMFKEMAREMAEGMVKMAKKDKCTHLLPPIWPPYSPHYRRVLRHHTSSGSI